MSEADYYDNPQDYVKLQSIYKTLTYPVFLEITYQFNGTGTVYTGRYLVNPGNSSEDSYIFVWNSAGGKMIMVYINGFNYNKKVRVKCFALRNQ